MQSTGNVQQLPRGVRRRGCDWRSVDAQSRVVIPTLDYCHAFPRKGGGFRWASIKRPRTLRHAFQTRRQCRGMERHFCDRVSSKFRALDGASTRTRSLDHIYRLRMKQVYLGRFIARISIQCEFKSQRFYCNLGTGKSYAASVSHTKLEPLSVNRHDSTNTYIHHQTLLRRHTEYRLW